MYTICGGPVGPEVVANMYTRTTTTTATAKKIMRDLKAGVLTNGFFLELPLVPGVPPVPLQAWDTAVVTFPLSKFETVMTEMQSVISGQDAAGPSVGIVDSVNTPPWRVDVHDGHQQETLELSASGKSLARSHA